MEHFPLADTLTIPCVEFNDMQTVAIPDGSVLEITMPSADENYADCFAKFTLAEEKQLNIEFVNYHDDVSKFLSH